MHDRVHDRKIAVIGLGYVGLPVALAFGRIAPTLGYDIDTARIAELSRGHDRTRECSEHELAVSQVAFTAEPHRLANADFFIVTVPTPIDDAKLPDLGPLAAASTHIGEHLAPGGIVVYESTVYPGVTEEHCVPILEKASRLRAGKDFWVGYSPERINPGDKVHTLERLPKIVSGQDTYALDVIANTYAAIVPEVHRAPSIKVAEAAKVIENTQRDLNIALMNELALIFDRLDIDTTDVLEAAGTKWNFLPFRPGLVGGHCIGVDPYYLTYKATALGYHPQVILAGRRINDEMAGYVASQTVKMLARSGKRFGALVVTVLGVTFKEDVPDLRNSKVIDIVRELCEYGITVQVADPYAEPKFAANVLGMGITPLDALQPADALILAVPHTAYVKGGWPMLEPLLADHDSVVIDVKSVLSREARPPSIRYWRL